MTQAAATDLTKFHELSFYTLAHPDPTYFIHQHVVDAYQAQTANEQTKSITIIFSLIGLYLFLERNYTGREVQLAHMALAQKKKPWPKISLPVERGEISVAEVLDKPAGNDRDNYIKRWSESVWSTYRNSHGAIAQLAISELES